MTGTTMSHALNAAVQSAAQDKSGKLKLPSQMEQVWRWVKNNPHRTVQEAAKATHVKETNTSSLLTQMMSRGMVTRRRGSRFGKGVWEYEALGLTYELLPKKSGVKDTPAAAPAEAPTTPYIITTTHQAFNPDIYTIGELRAIHAQIAALLRL